MSNIEYQINNTISSPAKEIKPCDDKTLEQIDLYPGQQFTIPLIAVGQTNSPVPTTIFWERVYNTGIKDNEDRLSPSSNMIDNNYLTCTNISFRLYSSDLDQHYTHTSSCILQIHAKI